MQRPIIGVNSTFYEDNHKWYRVPITYIHAIYEAGGLPLIFPCRAEASILEAYISRIDAMVFTGGDDYPPEWSGGIQDENTEDMVPARAETDRLVVAKIIDSSDIPVLGICAGHQLLAIHDGQALDLHIRKPEIHGGKEDTYHSVKLRDGSRLKRIFNSSDMIVNSNHHQAVDVSMDSDRYMVTAVSPDGIIEAFESRNDRFILGVQWHPERTKHIHHKKMLFKAFINEASERIK